MEIPLEVHLILCDILVDSRCLYLTCKRLYDRCEDKMYWTVRGDKRFKLWLPKIETTRSPAFFAKHSSLKMVKFLLPPIVETYRDDVIEEQVTDTEETPPQPEHSSIIKYLILVGADMTIACTADYDDSTIVAELSSCDAFKLACRHGHLDIVKYLVTSGRCARDDYLRYIHATEKYVPVHVLAYILEVISSH